MPREGYTSISIPNELVAELDDFLKTETAKKMGITSRADIVNRGLELFLESHRFIHINTYENRHDIYDLSQKKLISIYFKPDGTVWCERDESLDCKHVEFALESPEVQKALKEKGWIHKNNQ